MLAWFLWIAAIVSLILVFYGLHRLCLYLEDCGYMYYLRTKPRGGVAPAMLDLREIIQPSVRHVIEVQEDQCMVRDEAGNDPEPERPGAGSP